MTYTPQFCPTCQEERRVLHDWDAEACVVLRCLTCRTVFSLSDAERARQDRALRTVHEVVSKMREKRE